MLLLLLEGLQLGDGLLDLILHEKLGGSLRGNLCRSVAIAGTGRGRGGIALGLHQHIILKLLLERSLLGLQGLLEDVQFLAGEAAERAEAELVLQEERSQRELVLEGGQGYAQVSRRAATDARWGVLLGMLLRRGRPAGGIRNQVKRRNAIRSLRRNRTGQVFPIAAILAVTVGIFM